MCSFFRLNEAVIAAHPANTTQGTKSVNSQRRGSRRNRITDDTHENLPSFMDVTHCSVRIEKFSNR